MPAKTDFTTFNCSLARALAVVGDGWSVLIMRDAYFGMTRFVEFQRSLGIARNILADRLAHLIAHGMLTREGSESRPIYRPTAMGADLMVAIVALMQWGDRWLSPDGPPVRLFDYGGRPIADVAFGSDRDPEGEAPARLVVRPGPGADERTRAWLTGPRLHDRTDQR